MGGQQSTATDMVKITKKSIKRITKEREHRKIIEVRKQLSKIKELIDDAATMYGHYTVDIVMNDILPETIENLHNRGFIVTKEKYNYKVAWLGEGAAHP